MKIEIKNRYTGVVIFECEAESLREADLSWADLCGADLSWADLRGADLCGADLRGAGLRGAGLREADLREANLREANLCEADLREADLCGANLDYSCWPLWCGASKVKVDIKIAAQLAAHFCALSCEDEDYQKARKAILKFALKSHLAEELGLEGI